MVALEDCRYLAEEFFQKVGWLMPNEKLEDLNLRHVPATARNMKDLQDAIAEFGDGQEAVAPYPAHKEPSVKPEPRERKSAPAPVTVKAAAPSDAEWFMDVVVPVPHRGEKRDDYLKSPDTIGSLYNARHDDDEARRRLFGFVSNYEPKGWEKRDGTKMPPNEGDVKFREALDAFADFFEREHPDEKV